VPLISGSKQDTPNQSAENIFIGKDEKKTGNITPMLSCRFIDHVAFAYINTP
jgi:hypothetical protein